MFFAEDDYRFYIECLGEFSKRYNCLIHAYVLMTNHVHLLVTPQQECSVPQMMQSLGAKYVRYINKAYRRSGTLWEGRYKPSLVDTNNYLLLCMRYIELNPVRAGMTEVPAEYRWSSYQMNAYGQDDKHITPHPLYLALSENSNERLYYYRGLFANTLNYKQLHDIRDALNQELILGNSRFKEQIETMTNRRVELGKTGRPKVRELEVYYVY